MASLVSTPGHGLTRRTTIGIATGLSAAALLALKSPRATVAAQEEEILEAWAAAWSSGDPERVIAVFAEDGAYEDVPTEAVSQGSAEIATWAAGYFASVRDITQSVQEWIPIPNGVLVKWLVEATHTGSGNPVSFRGASILELSDGRIAREIAYYDNATIILQSGGVCELPEAEATPAAD